MSNIRDITVIYNQGYYEGGTPNVSIKKKFDVAVDLSTNNVWQYNGEIWTPYYIGNMAKALIGVGSTIKEKLLDGATTIPTGFHFYLGDDPYVPPSLRYTDKDLAIKHSYGDPTVDVNIYTFDSVSCVYVPVKVPTGGYQSSADGKWICIKNYVDLVGLQESTVVIEGIGNNLVGFSSSGQGSSSNPSTDVTIYELEVSPDILEENDYVLNVLYTATEAGNPSIVQVFDQDGVCFDSDTRLITQITDKAIVLDFTGFEQDPDVYLLEGTWTVKYLTTAYDEDTFIPPTDNSADLMVVIDDRIDISNFTPKVVWDKSVTISNATLVMKEIAIDTTRPCINFEYWVTAKEDFSKVEGNVISIGMPKKLSCSDTHVFDYKFVWNDTSYISHLVYKYSF